MTHERLQIIIKVLSELPYDVLMKNDGVEAIDPSIKNIRLFDWVPQTGVLSTFLKIFYDFIFPLF